MSIESVKTDPKTKPIFKCVDQYIDCCLPHLSESSRTFNRSKAKIQTYLASQIPIANSLGLAAQKGCWNFEEDCFSEIKQFFHKLFKE